MGQNKSLAVGEDLLNTTSIPSQITTNLDEVDRYSVGSGLIMEGMAKLRSTKDLWERDKRELLVWHHRLNHF